MSAVREYHLDWEPHDAQAEFVGDWRSTVGFVGGIGSGKTMAGWAKAIQMTPEDGLGLIVAPTYRQLKDGILASLETHFRPFVRDVNASEMRVELVSGTEILLRSSTRPDDFRSLNGGWMWVDEACYHSRYALQTALSRVRQGAELVWWTSSPVKNSAAHELFVQSGLPYHHCKSTDNPHLSADYIARLRAVMSVKEQAREIEAQWVDAGGVLFDSDTLAIGRVDTAPQLSRVVVGVDPATTAKARSDRTGIIVVGRGKDGHAYVLEDRSGQYAPHQWAEVVCELCREYNAPAVCEVNQGGDLVERNLRSHDARIGFIGVRASASKHDRAQPVAVLASRGWLHMVGVHRELERQMTTWEPSDRESPDRLDALVWAVAELEISYIPPSPTRLVRDDDVRPQRVIA